jgi:hypothetical protein
VTRTPRRGAVLLAAGLLVAILVGGRWLALETAERAWAATIPGGETYVGHRDLQRLVRGLFLLAAIAWGTGNLLFVYRAIGSVQLPRRLGDLEIVEAVPQPLLLAGTMASGLLYGLVLSLGTGDAWTDAAIAARAPTFGVVDPVLHRDLGYYVAQLPWVERLRAFALVATVSGLAIVALLYLGIGSLRFRRWLPSASAHARTHLGALLASLALTLAWGALLDPVQTVAGLHGPLTRGALAVRLPAAPAVAFLGGAAAIASIAWVVREKAVLLAATWLTLVAASALAFAVLPAMLGGAPPGAALAAAQRRFEGLAFGVDSLVEGDPPGFPNAAAATAAIPVWDAPRILAAAARRRDLLGARAAPAAAALSPHRLGGGRATWVVAPRPDLDSLAHVQPAPPDWTDIHRGAWARAGRPLAVVERDTAGGLELTPLLTADSATWFGPDFHEFAVAAPDSWPALRGAGLPLTGGWRRTALAWALQSPELARAGTEGLLLLWHRDVADRLQRLVPFATFDDPTPVVADGTLWWIAYGYLSARSFPLARPLPSLEGEVRYLRAGLVGAVSGASGDTRLFLAPGADSLATAWARLLAPLVRPADSVPPALLAQLPYPERTFRIAVTLVTRWLGDPTSWVPRPREPFQLAAPAPDGGREGEPGRVWTAQGLEAGDPARLAVLVAGAMAAGGPRLVMWHPPPALRPPDLVGSPSETAPGVLRLWNAGGALFAEQALFAQPATSGTALRIDTLFLTWGDRQAAAASPAAALRELLAAGGGAAGGRLRPFADTSLAGRWEAARRLAAQADAALAAGDLEAFGRYYAQLERLLGVGRRNLAPARGRH